VLRGLASAAIALVLGCSRHEEPARSGSAAMPAAQVAAWREDLAALAAELPAHHARAFFHTSEAAWRAAVAALDRDLPRLDDAHALVGLVRLVAMIGDGHTEIGAFGRTGWYPLALVWFDDGIFVVGAAGDASWAIGRKLVAITGHPIADVIAAVTPLVPHDNDAGVHAELPELLLDPAVLAGADLAAADHATFTLAAADGTPRELDVRPGASGAPVAFPKPLPLHLQGPNTNYWNRYVAEDRLLYFAYNACADDPRVTPFAEFAASTFAFADQHPVDRFVIDLRRNRGGNSLIIEPLIAGLAARPALAGRVFAIIGMRTFSSAMLDAMELKRRVHATLVGGPTSGKPSSYGEVLTFALPRSKIVVQYSTKLFSNPDFPGDAVAPDVPVTVRAADWFEGRDPALAAIMAAPVPGSNPAP
jgi:hypothetical protein